MSNALSLNPLETKKLFGLSKYFTNFIDLYKNKQFPKVTLLTGKKGLGKFTLVNHLLNYFFDKKSYDLINQEINLSSNTNKLIMQNIHPNIVYVNHIDHNRSKIDDIRLLINQLSKTTINNISRFVVIDNVEQLNTSCSNALLKIIEEPTESNYFILIDNQLNQLLETLASRCMKINLFLNKDEKLNIIQSLLNAHEIENKLNYKDLDISPGVFLTYNNLCIDNDIDIENDYLLTLNKILFLYKKNKNLDYINLLILCTEKYFYSLSFENITRIDYLNQKKLNIIKLINNFVKLNLNINAVINSIQLDLKNG